MTDNIKKDGERTEENVLIVKYGEIAIRKNNRKFGYRICRGILDRLSETAGF